MTGPQRILAFDCSGAACSAAVWAGGIRAERFEPMARGQGEALMPMIAAVMIEAGLDFPDLTAIAVTVGPGSFTGIRIGLAAARGLALATGVALRTVTGFEAVWAGIEPTAPIALPVVVLIDSKRGPVFAQRFDPDGVAEGGPDSVAIADLATWLGPDPVRLAGDGAAGPALDDVLGSAILRPTSPDLIRASAVGRFAAVLADLPAGGQRRPPPSPLYLRAPDVTLPPTSRVAT